MDRLLDLKFAALADPTRRAILARLARGEATVAELNRPFHLRQPTISKHLKVLEVAGLIEVARAAQSRPRRLKADALGETAAWVEMIRHLWHDSFDQLDEMLRADAPDPEEESVSSGDAADGSKPEFVITRVFKASRQRVWEAWTNPDLQVRWSGPKGAAVIMLTHDLRPGGFVHARLAGPDGTTMYGKSVYREVVPPSRLVWVHSFADGEANVTRAPFSATWPLEMLTTVVFEDAPDGTKVTLTWVPLNATAEEERTFAEALQGMHAGWSGSFDQLDALLAETA